VKATITLITAILMLAAAAGLAAAQVQINATPELEAAAQTRDLNALLPGSRLHFGHLGLDDGLSQSTVMAITQDSLGFLWFGTQDGLNRYDGAKIKIYRPVEGDDASLSDAWICTLALDAGGKLWAGTRQGGANRYDALTGKFTRFLHDDDQPDSLSHNNVHAIYKDAQDRLWLGTGTALDEYDAGANAFKHHFPPEIESWLVNAITEDSEGNLWLGTNKGLWRFNPSQDKFQAYPTGEKELSIMAVLVDADGTLWLASEGGGLVRFAPQSQEVKAYLPVDGLSFEHVQDLLREESGKIWVATSYGLNLFDPKAETFVQFYQENGVNTSLSNSTLLSFFADSNGILWIGTYGGGLSYLDPLENKFSHFYSQEKNPKSLSSGFIFSITPSAEGGLWIGTYGSGLERYDRQTGTFTHFNTDPENPDGLHNDLVYSLLEGHDGTLWIGTEAGLDRYDPTTGKFTLYETDKEDPSSLPSGAVFAIYQDRGGTIWVGASGGLGRFDQEAGTFRRVTPPEGKREDEAWVIIDILEDSEGMLWLGTFSEGVSRLDPETGEYTTFRYDAKQASSLSNDSILTIHESSDGQLWIGTAGGGLDRFNPEEGSFNAYTESTGLPNNVIYGILEDGTGGLWLSTNLGVARFDPKTGTSTNYTTADGLQSNEFNMGAYAVDAAGWMYFGGINGFNAFHPVDLRSNTYVPPVRLFSLSQNGKPLPGAEMVESLTITYPDNSFEFEAAALSYSRAKNNQFAYKLEGFEENWYYAGTNRSGRYANLPGGDYVLRVKAANSDGLWNEEGLVLKIKVIPPFWKAWWFTTLAGIAGAGLLAGVYLWRVRTVERQKRELERLVSERTRQIEQLYAKTKDLAILEERNRLARDLHDSAKQKAFAALAQIGAGRSLANGDAGKATRHLQEAETLVSEVIEEITFLIQELHPVALKEKGLAVVLRQYAFEWGNRIGIVVKLAIDGESRLPLEEEQILYRAIQEALANVARHSGAKAVEMTLVFKPDEVTVKISDNGQGFDTHCGKEGLGLLTIRERVEQLGGEFNIQSTIGAGTQLSIRVPVKGQSA
jgi:two-component system sensor histidine kinase ChiS